MRIPLPVSALPASVRAKITGRISLPRASRKVLAKLREASALSRRDQFYAVLRRARLPLPTSELQFHETRKWRFDFAWVEHRIALEVEGGIWIQGRHSRGAGMLADMEKYNTATVMGWRVLRVTPEQLTDRATEKMLKAVLK